MLAANGPVTAVLRDRPDERHNDLESDHPVQQHGADGVVGVQPRAMQRGDKCEIDDAQAERGRAEAPAADPALQASSNWLQGTAIRAAATEEATSA
jgi:hypothetical protein